MPAPSRRQQEEPGMDYLFVKLFWYIVVSFGIGIVVGWLSCSPRED